MYITTHKLDKLTADNVLDEVDRLWVGVLDLAEHEHHLRDFLGILVVPVPRGLRHIRLLRRRGHVGRRVAEAAVRGGSSIVGCCSAWGEDP